MSNTQLAAEMSEGAARALACEQEARDNESKWATLRAVILNGCREPDEAGEVGLHVATVAVAEAIRLGLAIDPARLVVTPELVNVAVTMYLTHPHIPEYSAHRAMYSALEAAFAVVTGDGNGT